MRFIILNIANDKITHPWSSCRIARASVVHKLPNNPTVRRRLAVYLMRVIFDSSTRSLAGNTMLYEYTEDAPSSRILYFFFVLLHINMRVGHASGLFIKHSSAAVVFLLFFFIVVALCSITMFYSISPSCTYGSLFY